jgi:hypothetical protein
MKTITILFAAVLTLTVNVLFAGNDDASLISNTTSISNILLAPGTPAVATFEDAAEEIVLTGLTPTTPVEADFNDSTAQDINVSTLAPVTPAFADFQ